MPISYPPAAGVASSRGVIGVGIAWTAAGVMLPGNQTYTDLGTDAVDTVFLDIGGVASSPHGLTDGKLLAPAAGTYMARANVGGYDTGHANAGTIEVQFDFVVNGSPLGMAEVYVQGAASVSADFHAEGDMTQPLVLAAGDLVGVQGGYSNSTSGASMKAFLYSFELEQIA